VSAEALLDPLRPVAGRYTLLQALTTVVEADVDWARGLGFTFEPTSCPGINPGSVVPIACVGDTATINPGSDTTAVTGSPFMVVATDKCSTFGFPDRDYEQRARDLLDVEQSFLIARELWAGAVTGAPSSLTGSPKNRQLASSSATTVTAAPSTPAVALAAVEQSLAVCGMNRRGLVHCRPQLMVHLAQNGSIRREGGLWLTPLDNIVVSDGGYSGSAPSTPATNPTTSQWLYGTSWMEVRLGPVLTFGGLTGEGVVRTINDVLTWAYRPAMVQWDQCCHFAAEVNIAALGSNP
jgi:hypothetical protein